MPLDREKAYPSVPMLGLDTLWLQVSGTVCNLACKHCFISCSPGNISHAIMTFAQVMPYLEEAESLGVKEYYFTGGEPLVNPDIDRILEAALKLGPCTVLTNGVLITPRRAAALKALGDASGYSLDIRVSLDGFDAPANDAIRGSGTFDRIMAGLGHLAAAGIHPVVTVTEACEAAVTSEGRTRLLALLASLGLPRPRLKVMPLLKIGAEARRTGAYADSESLEGLALGAQEEAALQCSSGRMVTSQGVYVCPILIDYDDARMGGSIASTLRPFPLRHRACHTCHAQGLSCRT